jgi:hypothetical protein
MRRFPIVVLMVVLVILGFMGTACAADKQAAGEEVILKGMVDENSMFIDEAGQAYKMAANGQAAKLMAQPGQKIEIKGTVMESDGVKTVVVEQFMALPE